MCILLQYNCQGEHTVPNKSYKIKSNKTQSLGALRESLSYQVTKKRKCRFKAMFTHLLLLSVTFRDGINYCFTTAFVLLLKYLYFKYFTLLKFK